MGLWVEFLSFAYYLPDIFSNFLHPNVAIETKCESLFGEVKTQ